jgi:hypothetical protein
MLVRFFAHSGLALGFAKQPYLARVGLEVGVHNAADTGIDLTAHPATKLVRVELERGAIVAIECSPPNRSVKADALSPRYEGSAIFEVGPGWSFSALEIA